jgi:hypothetical protein
MLESPEVTARTVDAVSGTDPEATSCANLGEPSQHKYKT